MSYQNDVDWFERDRKFIDDLLILREYYGLDPMKSIRDASPCAEVARREAETAAKSSRFPELREPFGPRTGRTCRAEDSDGVG